LALPKQPGPGSSQKQSLKPWVPKSWSSKSSSFGNFDRSLAIAVLTFPFTCVAFGCAPQNPLLERKKTTPGRGDCPAARTKAKQELIHQPGAAPPSSSTGRQLNYWQRRVLSGGQQNPSKFLNGVAASIFPPDTPGKSVAVAKHTLSLVEFAKKQSDEH
jgi:hypothetical protein